MILVHEHTNLYTPGLLLQAVVRLAAVHCCDVGSRCAVERRIGDTAHRQEVRPQTAHTQLGHVGQRLAYAAAEQEAAQLLVEAGHVEVPDEGLGADASETYPVTLPEGDLEVQNRRLTFPSFFPQAAT